jgi:hypothetical protein
VGLRPLTFFEFKTLSEDSMWEIFIVMFIVTLGIILFYFWLENITKEQDIIKTQELKSSRNI